MDGFRTARALVLDNDPKEAAEVIRALGSLGVAVLFHTGDDLEEKTLLHGGVRLLFVDMVLENLGASADNPKECASILVGTLGKLIKDDHHPMVVVCWTKHKDFKEDFEQAFRTTFPKLQFSSAILFDKDKLLDNADELLKQVREALQKIESFALLLNWEQQVHDAATDTSSEISRLVSERRSNGETWDGLAYKVCAALAIAERGTRLAEEDSTTTLTAFYAALNPLLSDRLERLGSNEIAVPNCSVQLLAAIKAEVVSVTEAKPEGLSLSRQVSDVVKRLFASVKAEIESQKRGKPKGSLLPDHIRASLNSMLHLAACEQSIHALPGTIWIVPESGETRESMNSSIPSLDWNMLRNETFENIPAVVPISVLVEVTPPCDFAQDKAAVSRLVPGCLVSDKAAKTKKAPYLWVLETLFIQNGANNLQGEFKLVLNVKFFSSVSRVGTSKWKPLYRLRESALTDLTAFIANHIGRVGFMKIEP